jgi:hypothetical protein
MEALALRVPALLAIVSSLEQRGWPSWALATLAGLSLLVLAFLLLSHLLHRVAKNADIQQHITEKPSVRHTAGTTKGFSAFQLQFLTVYTLVMLADWLQGTNMYTLYQVCPHIARGAGYLW